MIEANSCVMKFLPHHKMQLPTLQRILVIRLSALGDILLTTPVLRLLRQACPQARIDFLIKPVYQDLLRTHPCVDRLILYDDRQTLWQTVRELRRTRYDMVLDLHRTLRSRLLYAGLSARCKLAYDKRPIRRALLVHLGWNTLRPVTQVPEWYAAPLRQLGCTGRLGGVEMHLASDCRAVMQTYLASAFPQACERPLLAVAPGSRWLTKRWSVERFATVAQALAGAQQAAVIVLGGAEDIPIARELCRQLRVPVFDSTGKLSLMQTAALLQQCRLLLSNDSGLMHMATALQVPVVAVFGPTVQEFGFFPFQARAQVVSTSLACRPCTTKGAKRCPRGHHQCMQRVSSAQVLAAARRLWPGQKAL
ncbi:ADP-heptose--LPS heptosyltransferase 2 [Candidatus Entotheonellaceae bacterium PAL068K]